MYRNVYTKGSWEQELRVVTDKCHSSESCSMRWLSIMGAELTVTVRHTLSQH